MTNQLPSKQDIQPAQAKIIDISGKKQAAPEKIPYSFETEQAALGSVLIGGTAVYKMIADVIHEGTFLFNKHAAIWRACVRIAGKQDASGDVLEIDPVSIFGELEITKEQNDVGGLAYLTQLITACPNSMNAPTYARMIQRLYLRRQMLITADEIYQSALDEDISTEAVVNKIKTASERLMMASKSGLTESMTEIASSVIDDIEARQASGESLFMPTGFPEIDNIIGGLERGKYHLILGATSNGKSLLSLFMAYEMAKLGKRVLLISNEAEKSDMMYRLAAAIMKTPSRNLRRDVADDSDMLSHFYEVLGRLSRMPIQVSYQADLTPDGVERAFFEAQRGIGCDVVFVDQLDKMRLYSSEQLMSDKRLRNPQSKTEMLDLVSDRLLDFTRKNHIAFVMTHQTTKDVMTRDNKRPTKMDSAWSYKPVKDADIVMGVHREYTYDDTANANDQEVLVLKSRDNSLGECHIWFEEYPALYPGMMPQ